MGIQEDLLALDKYRQEIVSKRKISPDINIYVKGENKGAFVEVAVLCEDEHTGARRYINLKKPQEVGRMAVEDQVLSKIMDEMLGNGLKIRVYYTVAKWKSMRAKGSERALEEFKEVLGRLIREHNLEVEYTIPFTSEEQRKMTYLTYKEPVNYEAEDN